MTRISVCTQHVCNYTLQCPKKDLRQIHTIRDSVNKRKKTASQSNQINLEGVEGNAEGIYSLGEGESHTQFPSF